MVSSSIVCILQKAIDETGLDMPLFCVFSGVETSLFNEQVCCPALVSERLVAAELFAGLDFKSPRTGNMDDWR